MTAVQPRPPHDLGPIHPPRIERRAVKNSVARHVNIRVDDQLDHDAPAILHEPRSYSIIESKGAAVVLVSGAGGGVSGPGGNQPNQPNPLKQTLRTNIKGKNQQANTNFPGNKGIYPSLADKIALLLSLPTIRLDYRQPAKTERCASDIRAAFDYLSRSYNSTHFAVVGWSFGGSPCFTVASQEPSRLRGVVTIGTQSADTEGVRDLSPRPLLLLHGTGDNVLSPSCSESLYRAYGTEGRRELKFFEGDDHGLSRGAARAEKVIFDFLARCLGFDFLLDSGTEEAAGQDLVQSRQVRLEEMEEGKDLEGEKLE